MARELWLSVKSWEGPAHWRWVLTEAGGRFLADKEVQLDRMCWEWEAFTDLQAYLGRHAAPDRRLASQAQMVDDLGRWIGERIFGPLGTALLRHAPVIVHVVIPPEARLLAFRPLELATVAGKPLALQRVALVHELVTDASASIDKQPVIKRLRVLALFSLPVDASALNLRHERHELARLLDEIARVHGRAVELRVLQYGVTRERVTEAVEEAEGWDVLHVSGHGLAGGLVLETDDGSHDLVETGDLIELLRPLVERLKLVTLSACSSAALTVAEHLQLLGLGSAAGVETETTTSEVVPVLAAELPNRLMCAVLAMRYSVTDEFATSLVEELYGLMIGKGQPLPSALGLAMLKLITAAPTQGIPPLSVATPALFGVTAANLTLTPPQGQPLVFTDEDTKLAGFEPQPKRFVGQVGVMSRANAALAPRSGNAGLLLVGMAGVGKTSCALELAYTRYDTFARLVWYRAPNEDQDISGALSAFATRLEDALPGLDLQHLLNDAEALERFLPRLAKFFERNRILVVVDNVESLLTEGGIWRDASWGLLIDALTSHDGLSRVVMTSRRVPAVLNPRIVVEPVHALSRDEAVLLARELPNLRALADGQSAALDSCAARSLAARVLELTQGHPALLHLADAHAGDPHQLQTMLGIADQAWIDRGGVPMGFFTTGEPTGSEADYGAILTMWTRTVTAALPDAVQLLFQFLCGLEDDDRFGLVITHLWPYVWRRMERAGEPFDMGDGMRMLAQSGLVSAVGSPGDVNTVYRIHPQVSMAGREQAGDDLRAVVDEEAAAQWSAELGAGRRGQTSDEAGWLILRAGMAGMPYFLRTLDWETASAAAEHVLVRDRTRHVSAALLPALERIVDATRGSEAELRNRRLLALAYTHLSQTDTAERITREVLRAAIAEANFNVAHLAASDLLILCRDAGRLTEALTLAATVSDYSRRAGLGPWTQIYGEVQRLGILVRMGQTEQVGEALPRLNASIEALPEAGDLPEEVTPWRVREGYLDVARRAAAQREAWEEALALNVRSRESMQERHAPPVEIAWAAFSDAGLLLRLNRRDDALAVLDDCRETFQSVDDINGLGQVSGQLAVVEYDRGRMQVAIDHQRTALRYTHQVGKLEPITISHHNLGLSLRETGAPVQATAHLLTAGLLWLLTGNDAQAELTVGPISSSLAGIPDRAAAPTALPNLILEVNHIPGVRLDQLLEQLNVDSDTCQRLLDDLVRKADQLTTLFVTILDRFR